MSEYKSNRIRATNKSRRIRMFRRQRVVNGKNGYSGSFDKFYAKPCATVDTAETPSPAMQINHNR